MAEKIKLFELEIDGKKVVESLDKSRKEVEKLTKKIDELTEAEEDNGKEIEALTIQRQREQAQIRKVQKETKNLLDTQEENIGTLQRLRDENKKLNSERLKLNLETKEGQKRLIEINQQLDLNNAVIKENSDAYLKTKINVGNYREEIEKALEGNEQFAGGLVGTVKGLKATTAASLKFIATPIGVVLATIAGVMATLKAAFDRSLTSQEKLNVITGKMSAAFNLALDAVVPLIDFVLDTAIGALDGIGKAVGFVIDKLADWGLISEETRDKVTTSIDETSEAVNNLASAERQLAKSEIELQKLQLKFQTQAEKLRQIRDDESNSLADRIKANKELSQVLNRQAAAEFKAANVALKIAKQRELLNNESVQSIQEKGAAEVKLLEIQERITSQRSEQLANENALRKELADEQASRVVKNVTDEVTGNEAIKQSRLSLADESIDASKRLNTELKKDKDLAIAQRALDNEQEMVAAQQQIFGRLSMEREALATKEAEEVQAAKDRGLKTTAIEQKFSDARKEIDKAENDAKLSLASGFLGNIAQIAGEGTAVGKAAAVAQTTVSTFQAAQGAYASLAPIPIVGPVLGIAAAGAAVASGVSNVKKILSVKSGLPNDSAAGGGISSPSVPNVGVDPIAAANSSVSAQVGQGIVSRDSLANNQQQPINTTAVIIDQVTAKQNSQTQNDITRNA